VIVQPSHLAEELLPFSCDVERRRGGFRVVPRGDVDTVNAPTVQRRLTELMEAGVVAIVLDLARTTFMDSRGLQVLLTAHEAAGRAGVRLTIAAPPPAVQRLFEVACVGDRLAA
jgi:anti-anti-sigma factor